MTKHITLCLYQDGSGNNKINNTPTGNQSNVARMYEYQEADYSFNVSVDNNDEKGAEKITEVTGDNEGNKIAFHSLVKNMTEDDSPVNIKLYSDGVGSQDDDFIDKTAGGGCGLGTDSRVEALVEAVKALCQANNGDVVIDLNGVGFSRGSFAMKAVLMRIAQECPEGRVQLHNVVLYDPVAAIGIPPITENLSGDNADYPADLINENTHITEVYVANEYRNTFNLYNYTEGNIDRIVVPGAHSQGGGGYFRDILAAGSLAYGMKYLSGKGNLSFKTISVEDYLKMRLYNAIIENPVLVQALITDSRLKSDDLVNPGQDAFALEWRQDYEFDHELTYRDYRQANDPELDEFFAQICSSPPTVEGIAAMAYRKFILPDDVPDLSSGVESVFSSFLNGIKNIGYNADDPDASEATVIESFNELYSDFRENVGWLRAANQDDMDQIYFLDRTIDTLEDRIDIWQEIKKQQEVEAEARLKIAEGREIREDDLALLNAQNVLSDAIKSGDTLEKIAAGIDYLSALDERVDQDDGEEGFLGNTTEYAFDLISSGIGLGQSIDEGNDWAIVRDGVDFTADLNNYLNANEDTDGFLSKNSADTLKAVSSGIGLAMAIDDGRDSLTIVQSGTEFAADINTLCGNTDIGAAINGAASALSFAINISQIDDVFASGNAGAVAYTTASTINSAINTFNYTADVLGYTDLAVDVIPGLGYFAAGMQLAHGDTQDAAITAFSTFLMTQPYGWIAVAALQIGSMLLSDDSPPEATASFTLDENGNVVMSVGGDGSMQGLANSVGGQMLSVMQNYKDSGGRLMIEGGLPSFKVIAGEKSQINYGQPGGKICVLLDDLSEASVRMYGALVARDYGEKLDRAVKVATLPGGVIDWSKVDSIMSGYGFTKRGDNYVIGETKELYGTAVGTGVFRGGGQMGPEGQLFTAATSDIKSLPSKTSPLPSQQMGEIIKIVSAQNFLSGSGCELAAMSLILGAGLLGTAETSYGSGQHVEKNVSKPLDGFSLEDYLGSLQADAYLYDVVNAVSYQVSFPDFGDEKAQYQFFKENWSELLKGYDWDDLAKTKYLQQQGALIDYNGLLTSGTKAPWWKDEDVEDHFEAELGKAVVASSGQQLVVDQIELKKYSQDVINDIEVGAFFSMSEDTVLRFLSSSLIYDLAASGYEIGEAVFELVSFADVQNGKIWFDQNGDIRFAPTADFVGTASFTYTLRDSQGSLVQKQALIEVHNVNDDPTINDDLFTLNEGQNFYLDRLLVNDFDVDGDSFVIDHLRGVENGSISQIGGRLVFIPDDGFYGDTSFSYWVRDHSNSYPVMGKATLIFQEVNSGGVAGDDRFLILEDSTLITTPAKLLENDIDYDGEQLRFNGIGEAVNGSVAVQSDGTIKFSPVSNYTGENCGFYYSIKDESGNITQGWVGIEVLDQREPPVIICDTMASINEDEVFTFSPDQVAKFIWDADGDAVHLDSITNIQGGQVSITDGYLSFVPDENFSGAASFDYCAADNYRGTVSGHLSFEILPVNDVIETGQDLLTTQEDNSVTTTVADLLSNDTDIDGTVITFMGVGASKNGAVAIDAANTITFIPETNYAGDDAGFEYYVADSEGDISTGWVQVRVAAVNDAPEIVSTAITGSEDTAVIFDAVVLGQLFKDVDGDNLSVTKIEVASGGVVSEKDCVYTFIPDPDYVGTAKLTITVDDGNGGVLTESVEISLTEQDDPAIIGLDAFTTIEEQSVTITVNELMHNDSDADGALFYNGIGQVFNGAVTVSSMGEIVFTPDKDYFGDNAGFEYKVIDSKGFEGVGRVTIEVTGVNDAPAIIATELTTLEDQPIIFTESTIAKFIDDADGDPIALTAITNVHGGTVTESGGVYTFNPDADYYGYAYLEYNAADKNGEVVTGSLDISVLAQNDATSFGNDVFTTDEEQSITLSVAQLLANDIDQDGELTFSRLGEVKNGTVVLNADGNIKFSPAKDYSGNDAGFYYVVEDAQGYESTGWVTIDVLNVNDTPVITGSRLRISEDETIAFTPEEIAKFLFDADGDLYSLDLVANVSGGLLELKNGVYTFTPDADYYGDGYFEYTAVSASGDSIDGEMNLIIEPVNDLPITTASSATGIEDNEIIFQIDQFMAGVSDVEDGSNVQFDGINSSLNGDVYVDHVNNALHFIPDDDFFGDAGFCYDVVDTEGGINQGYVSIRLTGVNDAPVAQDDDKIMGWSNKQYENVYLASTFLTNDSDVDNDPLSIVSVSAAEFGTVTLDAAGNIHYTAASDGWVGIDSFSYTISDGQGETSTATVSLDVKINTSPDIYPELLYTKEDIISIIKQDDLLANDSDIDGDVMKIIAVDQAEHCSVELLSNGDIKFTPELNYNNNYPGQASFSYTVSDGISDSVTTVAFFEIDPVNDAPILVAERISGAVEDNKFSFQVSDIMANDTDVEMASAYEEDDLLFVDVFDAAHGAIYSDGSGTIFYTPNANFFGLETFKYRVVDSYGAESVIESEIWVEAVNDIPVVQEDIATSVAEDSIWNKYSIRDYLTANDTDVDGDVLSIKNARVVSGNAEVKIADGYLQVKPAFGEDYVEVDYTVTDGNGGNVVSKLTIPNIREHNFAPEITNTYATTYSSSSKVIFSFLVQDKNGGNNWSNNGADMGDIASITAGHLSCSDPSVSVVVENSYGHFLFRYSPFALASPDFYANLTITAIDQAGASSTKYVSIDSISWSVGIHNYPVVLDLDGDGVELLSASDGVIFDWNGSTGLEKCGWAAADDGFLVYDYDGDQRVTMADELSLKEYDPEAKTDLEGLQAFDSNKNGVFESGDEKWAEFGVWQDSNSNGVTDEGEFKTLGQHGITAIYLESDGNQRQVEGNTVYGATTYELDDGSIKEAFDVGLTSEMVEAVLVEMPGPEVDMSESTYPEEVETQAVVSIDSLEIDTSLTLQIQELTDAELDRQFAQLQSDIAGSPELDSCIDIAPCSIEDLALVHVASDDIDADAIG